MPKRNQCKHSKLIIFVNVWKLIIIVDDQIVEKAMQAENLVEHGLLAMDKRVSCDGSFELAHSGEITSTEDFFSLIS